MQSLIVRSGFGYQVWRTVFRFGTGTIADNRIPRDAQRSKKPKSAQDEKVVARDDIQCDCRLSPLGPGTRSTGRTTNWQIMTNNTSINAGGRSAAGVTD